MRSPVIEGAERNHGKGRPGHGPENSGKNRRGGRNPLAKKRRLREEPAFGFPFLNWWRWWELKSDWPYPKIHHFESCRGGIVLCVRMRSALAGKERHELAHKTGTKAGQFRRGTRGRGGLAKLVGGGRDNGSGARIIFTKKAFGCCPR